MAASDYLPLFLIWLSLGVYSFILVVLGRVKEQLDALHKREDLWAVVCEKEAFQWECCGYPVRL